MHRPLIMAHRVTTRAIYKKSMGADIFDIDIRKSRDGVLYCFHGSVPFGLIAAYFLRFLPWSAIQKIISVERLDLLLTHITGNPIIFCDLKQCNITARDLSHVFAIRHFTTIWIAAISFPYLTQLKHDLGSDHYRYVYNFGLFFLRRGLRLAKNAQVDIVQLFFWQYSPRVLSLLSTYHLDHALCSFFLSRKRYKSLAAKHSSLWVYYDYL